MYCETLFKLRRAIQNKQRGKLSKGIVFCTIMHIPTRRISLRFSSTIFSGTYSRICPTLRIWHHPISMHFPPFNVILRENGKPLFRWSRTVCIHSSQSRRHRSMLKASQNSSHDTRNVLITSVLTFYFPYAILQGFSILKCISQSLHKESIDPVLSSTSCQYHLECLGDYVEN